MEVIREKCVGLRRKVNYGRSAVPDEINRSGGLQKQGREDGDGAGPGDVNPKGTRPDRQVHGAAPDLLRSDGRGAELVGEDGAPVGGSEGDQCAGAHHAPAGGVDAPPNPSSSRRELPRECDLEEP